MLEKERLLRQIREKIVYYLHRRDHSAKELQQKLKRFEYPADLILTGIEWAKERGYLGDPQRLSERHVERLQKKKKGQKYIQNYLSQKGLPPARIDTDEELSNARKIAQSMIQKIQSSKTKTAHKNPPLNSQNFMQKSIEIDTDVNHISKQSKKKSVAEATTEVFDPLDRKDKEKIGRKLLSRGFSLEIVRKIIYEEL